MPHIIKYLPAFIDDEDEPYTPIEVNSFQDIVAVDFVKKWTERTDADWYFSHWEHFPGWEGYGYLVAVMHDIMNGPIPCIICRVSDISLISFTQPSTKI